MATETDEPRTVRVPSLRADAAATSVSPHTVHIQLASSQPDGTFVPVLHLALPASVAADLAVLLARSVEKCDEMREQSLREVEATDHATR
jgi:hypothetical protein